MEVVNLHPSVEELVTKICTQKNVEPPDISARRILSTIAEGSAIEILNKISLSSNIQNFSGFIVYMVNKQNSQSNGSVLSQKRPGSPLSGGTSQKCACYESPNSKQLVLSPCSPYNCKTIPEYYPCQTQVSLVNPPKTFNPVSCVPKRLTFPSVCGTEDAHNNSNISQQPIATQNVSCRFVGGGQTQHTLSPCSPSKRASATYVSEFPFATQNGSQVSQQHTLLPSQSFVGATLGNVDVGCGAVVPNRVDNATRVNPMTQNQSDIESSLAISQQSLLLAELEFRKMFLVYSYVGRRKLEDVVSVQDAIDIKSMKAETMIDFEAKIWAKYGRANCKPSDRAMHLDWDSGKTYLYHCYVSIDGTYRFTGPFLNTRRTHLQRVLGDENVLIVQFTDVPDYDMQFNQRSAAKRTISGGITIGWRHYSLWAFKDGRGDSKKPKDKKKSRSSWAVKGYFVRHKSPAQWLEKGYILFNKTMHEARCLFMHVHTTPSISKYISRCSLALSNTIKLRVDLATVDVQRIEDIPCRDENGKIVCDKDGEPLIHTDGTGFISEDLAILCAKHFIEGNGSEDDSYEFVDLLNLEEESLGMEGDPPLLVQCRIFKDGYAVKGTLLVNKKLQPRTIQVRPSMIKVERDPTLLGSISRSSLEICSISRKPRKASLSKNLIALLTVGGVPKEYFMELLNKALQEALNVSSSMRAAIRLALNYAQMDDNATSAAMIGSGIPLDEPYLQSRMSIFKNEERKKLRSGKIPIDDSFYLYGTADPTGTLENDEVCVILENGQLSGNVLVYRNPGVHFGDVHILKAKYVKSLEEEFVGNAKYGIFFSTKGRRSVGSEIANGDFDGDRYFVSHNNKLLHYFKASKPWERTYFTPSAPSKKPRDLSRDELEEELVDQLFATRNQTMVAGISGDSWLTFADQHIVLGKDDAEKPRLEEKMVKLTDLYYDALDAGKSGKTVEISKCLSPQKYPHFMEKNPDKSYHSSSVLGLIYDTVKGYQSDNAPIKDVWKLPCFDVEIPAATMNLWKDRYKSYKGDMVDALESGDESKNNSADIVIEKYKKMLYEAEDFAKSTRRIDDIYNEALAIYHICYDTANSYRIPDIGKCRFAWRVAGEALCSFYASKAPGRSIPFKVSV